MPRQKPRDDKTEHVRVDIRENDPLQKILYYIKQERGLTQNTELIRLLLKEEYNRLLESNHYPISQSLKIEIDKLIEEHPEYGYHDEGEFVRAAVRAYILSPANDQSKPRKPR